MGFIFKKPGFEEEQRRKQEFLDQYPTFEKFADWQRSLRQSEREYGLGCRYRGNKDKCSAPYYPCTRDENNTCSYTDRKAPPNERIEPLEEVINKHS
ncbi:hypothetical protein GOV06_03305 [Candidatus Woesearchaeota archaeon]|nr:hypothetical protein [Candidatus Woesearchaeota archaeon]